MRNLVWGKMKKDNLMVPAIKSHKVTQTASNSNDVLPPRGSHALTIIHKNPGPQTTTHNDEKIVLVLAWQAVLPYGIFFYELVITILSTAVLKILYDS